MSFQVTTAFVDMYKSNVDHLVRQSGSRLRETVVSERINGKQAYFEQIGGVEAMEKTGRHQDVEYSDTPHRRRRCTTRYFYTVDLIDEDDKIRMLIDPSSDYAKAQSDALGLKVDQVIIDAATALAYTGVDGTTSTAFDTSMVVDVQVRDPGVTAADYGLNVAKLLRAHRLLTASHVPMEDRFLIPNARQMESLLNSTKATSADYASVKALVQGEIDTYCGFKFRSSEYIKTDANSDDMVLFYHKRGLKLGLGKEMTVNMDRIPQKHNAMQVYSSIDVGATRMQEPMVGYIACDIAAGPGGT
jgi:hypothetical protein